MSSPKEFAQSSKSAKSPSKSMRNRLRDMKYQMYDTYEKNPQSMALGLVVVLAVVAIIVYMAFKAKSKPMPAPAKPAQPAPGVPMQPSAMNPELQAALKRPDVQLVISKRCPHCMRQLEEIGGQSATTVIDCTNGGHPLCSTVNAYPTWIVAGKYYPGFRTQADLLNVLNGRVAAAPPPQPRRQGPPQQMQQQQQQMQQQQQGGLQAMPMGDDDMFSPF